jgi:hypothetical protein
VVYFHLTELEEAGGGRINVWLAVVYTFFGKWGCVLLFFVPGVLFAVLGVCNVLGVLDEKGRR